MARLQFRAPRINSRIAPARADGMLCYKLLGDEAQSSFARSWGISYGVGAASEWKARACVTRAVSVQATADVSLHSPSRTL